MKPIYYCCGLFLLVLSACKNQTAFNVEYLVVPSVSALPESTKFSSLLEDIRYIIPETNDECLFSYIYKAYIDRERIFILDKRNQDKILVFDSNNGRFLMSIGTRGRAKNEYAGIGNFTLDKDRGLVLILDEMQNKVLVYDATSGDFKNQFELDFVARNIEYVDDNTLAYAGGGQHQERLCITDMDGSNMRSYVPSNDKNWILPLNSFSRGSGKEVVFRTYLSDSLYTVTPEVPLFSRFIDFGKGAFTWDEFNSYNRNERDNIEEYLGKYRTNMKYYSETDDHIWFIYSNKGVPECVVFDKTTSNTFNYSMFLHNDVVFDQFAPLIVASDEGYFIGQNDAFSIVENIEQSRSGDIPEELRNLTLYNNPVITFLKFKK